MTFRHSAILCAAALLFGAAFLLMTTGAEAQNFTVNTATTSAKTISSGTGTITSTGSIVVSSGKAVTMSGTASLDNSGLIEFNGTNGNEAITSSSGTTLTITNQASGTIRAASGDGVRVRGASTNVSLINFGTIIVTAGDGGQAVEFDRITSGNNSVDNRLGGLIQDTAEDAIKMGVNGIITNAGTIKGISIITAGEASGSDGIDTGVNSGVEVSNTGLIQGRHGITGGDTNYHIEINNNAGGILRGSNGSGINIDVVSTTSTATVNNAFGGTIEGGVLAGTTEADGDGVDVDGVLTLDNAGNIYGKGAKGLSNAEAIAAGGGTIINRATGQIIGSSLAEDAPNADNTRESHGILIDDSNGGNAIAATSIDNSGLIQGKGGYGVRIIGTFADTIDNKAGGTIRGTNTPTGDAAAVVQTGDGNDQVTNAGTIQHDGGSTQTAVALEGGNDTLTVTGGTAVIVGGIDGGAGTDTVNLSAGAGNTFTYAGAITNVETLNVNSGIAALNGSSVIAGTTTVGDFADLRVNGTLQTTNLLVNGAGNLGGTGEIKGNVQLNGTLSAGNSVGTLAVTGQLDITPTVENHVTPALIFELGAPGSSDLVLVTGELVIGTGFLEFEDFTFTDVGVTGGVYTLFSTSSAINGSLGGNLAGMIGGRAATLSLGDGGTDVILTVVPEPGSAGLAGIAALGLVAVLRRRRQ